MAHSRRRRSLLTWDGFPYLALLVFFLVGSTIQALVVGPAHTVVMIILILCALAFLWWIWRLGSRPDRVQRVLSSVAGLNFIDAVPSGAKRRTGVSETRLFQSKITVGRAWSGDETFAVLVPGVTRGLRFDLRVIAEIQGKDTLYPVGYLARDIDQEWLEILSPLAERGIYLRVPATIIESKYGPLSIDLDLGGAREAAATASHAVATTPRADSDAGVA